MCDHGEPKGPAYCALCRHSEAKTVIRQTPDDLMIKALDAKDAWKIQAELAIRQLKQRGQSFTADDVINLVGLPAGVELSGANNAVGALFRSLSQGGEIKQIGWTASKRAGNNGRAIRLWAGA